MTLNRVLFCTESEKLEDLSLSAYPNFSPYHNNDECMGLELLIRDCWSEEAPQRPPIAALRIKLQKIVGKTGLLESLLDRLRNHTDGLEVMVLERQHELRHEQLRCDSLLEEMLPR